MYVYMCVCELTYKRIKGTEGIPCNFIILVYLNLAAIRHIAVITTHCNHRCMSSRTVKTKIYIINQAGASIDSVYQDNIISKMV